MIRQRTTEQLQNQKPKPQGMLFAAAGLFVLAAWIASVCIGKYPIHLRDIWAILTGGEVKQLTKDAFLKLRLPRSIMGILAGLGLGMSGSIYQTLFKNALASPDIIGVSAGANLGSAVAIVLLGASTAAITTGAFVGGLAVAGLLLLLVRIVRGKSTATYVLAGIVMTNTARALIMMLKYFADPQSELAAIEFWTMGTFANVTAQKVTTIAPIFLFAFVALILLRRQVDLLSLNEEEARTLGVDIGRMRTIILALSTLLVSSVISITGLISFVGLVAPHIARLMLRRSNFSTTVMSCLVGAGIVLVADTLARCIYSSEIPISILTTFLGVPVLVYFLCKQKEMAA